MNKTKLGEAIALAAEVHKDQVDKAGKVMKETFIIGDVHGHLDRLEALLAKAGLLDDCPRCWEEGMQSDCPLCDGDGLIRDRHPDAEVVMVGDIGHWGRGGSPTGDLMTLKAAIKWADVLLWGNHDRALVDAVHHFSGYQAPQGPEVWHLLKMANFKLAHEAHGFLITHAGLGGAFQYNKGVPEEVKRDPAKFADWINEVNDPDAEGSYSQFATRDAIGAYRGGLSPAGGILWRDINEKLYYPFRQVFGHSADNKKHQVRYCWHNNHSRKPPEEESSRCSYCIDVGGKGDRPGDECLAGIWLPQERIVRVDL